MASILPYETKNGRKWRVKYHTPDNGSTAKSGFKTKREAQLWSAENIVKMSTGDYVAPADGKITVGKLGPEWLDGKRGVMKASSIRSLDTSWKIWVEPQWSGRQLNTIRKSEVQKWVSGMAAQRSATVTLRAFGILKGIYEAAQDDRLVRYTPCEGVKLPVKRPKGRVYLNEEQLFALSREAGTYRLSYAAFILVLGLCGLRWGEASRLRVKDILFGSRRIRVEGSATKVGSEIVVDSTKGNARRETILPRAVARLLRPLCDGKTDDELVFIESDGAYMRQQSVGKGHNGWFKKCLLTCGLPLLAPHDLRHTAASIAVHNGANVKALQRMLGHKSAVMTLDIYADLFDDDLNILTDQIDDATDDFERAA
jgi:integrase